MAAPSADAAVVGRTESLAAAVARRPGALWALAVAFLAADVALAAAGARPVEGTAAVAAAGYPGGVVAWLAASKALALALAAGAWAVLPEAVRPVVPATVAAAGAFVAVVGLL